MWFIKTIRILSQCKLKLSAYCYQMVPIHDLVDYNEAQRFAAWRSGGFLAQKFNRRTALEPTTKLSYEALNPPLRQTAVSSRFSFYVVIIFTFLAHTPLSLKPSSNVTNCPSLIFFNSVVVLMSGKEVM
ncbi:hypothetical protein SAMN04488519_103256 [Algoriphagus ornithinivorans]|uniref:Uncharacterized protein n=1 Tax=Algoriphagus ornithinivorans TaxID=226506 RepID=A0A1I5E2F1_9BACT|nr:hypothetical protein SAMN04488519_103256 [Algoriphagus ornithinivorans]